MKALTYQGAGRKEWMDVPDPQLAEPTDAIVGIDAVTICGTDLHILKGDVPEVAPGRVLGHEAVGTVEAIGSSVSSLQPGDHVLISCISSCGRCRYCLEKTYGQCLGDGGWVLGHTIDGVQAEYARVPFADTSVHRIPFGLADEAVLMLADIMPTAYEIGVLNGHVKPADTVVVVGAGPIGLATILTARLCTPSHIIAIDVAGSRLDAAKRLGADMVVNSSTENAVERVHAVTEGLGADVVVEAVGVPETFELCTTLVRPSGHVANIGVHGQPATLHLEDLWFRNVTITTGLVDTFSTPMLLRLVNEGHLQPAGIVTHHFSLDEILTAYDVFGSAAETGALKVVMTRT